MIQNRVDFDRWEENLDRAAGLVREAAGNGAQICVLPECGDLGWGNGNAETLAQPIPGPVSHRLSRMAQENRVMLAAGLTEREGDALYNTALLFSDTGALLLKHRKINILTGVEGLYTPGTSLSCVDTPLGRIGLLICADNLAPSLCLGHALGRMGVQLLLSPSAWAVPPEKLTAPYGQEWRTPYHELSSLYGMAVVGVSNVGCIPTGPWAGWSAIGHSIAYDSDGALLCELPHGEQAVCAPVISVTLRPPALRGTDLAEYVDRRRPL